MLSIIAMLCFSCLLLAPSTSCIASSHTLLIGPAGGACAAEQTVPPSAPIQTEAERAVLASAKTLFVRSVSPPILLVSLLVALLVFSFYKRVIEPGLTRHGPVSTKTFLPYLFATHGM